MIPFLFDESGLAAVDPMQFARLLAQWRAAHRDAPGLGAIYGRIAGRAAGEALAEAQRQVPGGDIAVIPIHGVISKRASFWSEVFGGTALDELSAQLLAARDEPSIRAVVLHVESPGGAVSGVDETAALVAEVNKSKPVVAFADGLAASAAYWLIASASRIVATPSSEIGSIGVYAVHFDHSGELAAAGVVPTLIKAGEFKAEGNPYQPLSDEDRAAMQSRIDAHYDRFIGRIAKGRGASQATVRAKYGKGRVLTATDAHDVGMVTDIGLFGDALRIASTEARTRTQTQAQRSVRSLADLRLLVEIEAAAL